MSLRDDFLQHLAPEYAWTRVDVAGQKYLVTHHRDVPLRRAVRLHLLDDEQFARYAEDVARSSEDGDVQRALGLIFIHVDEEITVDSSAGILTDVGLERRRRAKPSWFTRRVPEDLLDTEPDYAWVLDPPGA
jgi:hypothetical protein